MMNSVSIIILNYGRPELTIACLQALYSDSRNDFTEIVLLDNGSAAEDRNVLRAAQAVRHCNYLEVDTNLGFAAGCNRAAKEATGDTLIFLNNDTRAHSGWIAPLVDALNDDAAGVSGSLLHYPNGRLQHGGIGAGVWGLPLNLDVGLEPEERKAPMRESVLAVTGACLAVRGDLFEALGGFDEDYFFSYEDVDLCMRARVRGFHTTVCADSSLVHLESASMTSEISAVRAEAEDIFLTKWGSVLLRNAADRLHQIAAGGVRRIVVYGRGRAARRLLDLVETIAEFELLGFTDNAAGDRNDLFCGYPVFPSRHIPSRCDAIIIASMFIADIRARFAERPPDCPVFDGVSRNIDEQAFETRTYRESF